MREMQGCIPDCPKGQWQACSTSADKIAQSMYHAKAVHGMHTVIATTLKLAEECVAYLVLLHAFV